MLKKNSYLIVFLALDQEFQAHQRRKWDPPSQTSLASSIPDAQDAIFTLLIFCHA